jgi:hypothetical protein
MLQARALAVLLAFLLTCVASGGRGAPAIALIAPPGAPRGGEVEIRINGRDLADPREVYFEDGEIAVVGLEPIDKANLKARLRIPATCPTGSHRLRVRTKEGLSELRTFRVGFGGQLAEQEPNSDVATAQAVTPPCTVTGVITREDADCFKVSLPAGGRIAVAVEAIRLDQEMFDPLLEVVDARGEVLASSDDHPLLGQDAMLAVTVKEAGDYVVRLRESTFGGNDGCVYLLHVGDFPVAHLAWPPAGPPGGRLAVSWIGDPAGPFTQSITLPASAPPAGLVEIHPVREGVASPVPVPVRLTSLAATTEAEPNDSPGEATAATAPAGLCGRLGETDDVDWFRVTAPKGSKWYVRSWGRRLGSPIDLVVNLYRDDAKRARITGNDDAEGPDAVAQLTVPEEGSFLVRVNDHQRRGGPEFVYWIDVEPMLPEVNVSVPPARTTTQEGLVAAVPQGNRTALLLNTARTEFGESAQVKISDLPAGVVAHVPDAAGNAPATLAVFEAAADAPATTTMATVQVATAETGQPLGGLRQKTELVFGQPNNAPYRIALGDRLPLAVVEQAPIRVELEQPAVPIVRRGSLELKVRVERLDGFQGKVRLFLPFKPPGVGAAATAEIPADQSEGVYLLSATADAPLGEWQLAVTARPQPEQNNRGDSEMLVASSLVTLRVTEPIVELTAEPTAVEQGQAGSLVWKVQKPGGFTGAAKAKLLGLPAKTEAPELDLVADAAELAFPLTVGPDAPAGPHKNVFCELRVPQGDAWVVHATAPVQLRIDKPLPPEEATP